MGRGRSGVGGERNSIVQLNTGGWTYPGITEQLDKIENRLNKTNSANTIRSLSLALREQDRVITRAMESDTDGDTRVLMSLRRRTRQLMGKAQNKI